MWLIPFSSATGTAHIVRDGRALCTSRFVNVALAKLSRGKKHCAKCRRIEGAVKR